MCPSLATRSSNTAATATVVVNRQDRRRPTTTSATTTRTFRPKTCRSRYDCGSSISHTPQTTQDPQETWIWWLWFSWMAMLCDALCLLGFILALLPGFVRFAWYYVVASHNRTFCRYGTDSCRQGLDVYSLVVSPQLSSSQQVATRRNSNDSSSSSQQNTEPLLYARQSSQVERGERDLAPVVLFFPGGAWMIGYKMWAALTARVLSQMGIVTVVADYRNHPFGTIPDMVDDVEQALEWVQQHIEEFGGDAQQITVVGQSAGGHLVTTACLRRAKELLEQGPESTGSWHPSQLAGLISVSAPYSFVAMSNTFRRHGLSSRVLDRMFAYGEYTRDDYDPLCLVQEQVQLERNQENNNINDDDDDDDKNNHGLAKHLPPRIQVWHGTRDTTVNWTGAEEFGRSMEELCRPNDNDNENKEEEAPQFEFRLYQDWTHTDAILEAPMSGTHDFHKDLFDEVVAARRQRQVPSSERCPLEWTEDHAVLKPMWCSPFMAEMGRFFIPF